MGPLFPRLFSEIAIGGCVIANRIVSTGHHTYLADGVPGEALIAYHEARARGGAGLIVTEIVATHPSAGFSGMLLRADAPDCIAAYARLARACKAHGARLFAQLFHPGREILSSRGGLMPVAWAPSAVPTDRFHIMPKAMPAALIEEIVEGHGRAARHLAQAGFDGFEIVASHGYLPSQFFNPRLNLREDGYGGDFERRLRFARDAIAAVRANAPEQVVGLRISADEMDEQGLDEDEVLAICRALAPRVDYLSVTAGTSASLGGSLHIAPPMGLGHAAVAAGAGSIRAATARPVIVTGRINQPQIAEQILARGEADLCGMTRALICDPQLPAKAQSGEAEAIRACIGCNQACIGRAHKGLGVSCIQHPESGREREFPRTTRAARLRRVLVAGGGPAGMKAAAVAAARGHEVTLCERERRLGGQARLAGLLPGRAEFGGLIDNLRREMDEAGVQVMVATPVTPRRIEESGAGAVVLAVGARPYVPAIEGVDQDNVVDAWQVLSGEVRTGQRVVIADWRADWIGLGLAERLATEGCHVRLCVNAAAPGEALQTYTRNHHLARVHRLGVEWTTHLRLFGVDGDTVYFQHVLSGEAFVLETDTLVLALGHRVNEELEAAVRESRLPVEILAAGDCVAPRSAEEAVLDGLRIGRSL